MANWCNFLLFDVCIHPRFGLELNIESKKYFGLEERNATLSSCNYHVSEALKYKTNCDKSLKHWNFLFEMWNFIIFVCFNFTNQKLTFFQISYLNWICWSARENNEIYLSRGHSLSINPGTCRQETGNRIQTEHPLLIVECVGEAWLDWNSAHSAALSQLLCDDERFRI